jgi:outer membrane biosynthesis protein TonB
MAIIKINKTKESIKLKLARKFLLLSLATGLATGVAMTSPITVQATDWEEWEPEEDPTWDAENPVIPDDEEDEVDRKEESTPTPTPAPTATPTPAPTSTPTPAPTPTPSATPTPSEAPSPTPSETPSATPTPTTPVPRTDAVTNSKSSDMTPWVGVGIGSGAFVLGMYKIVESIKRYKREDKKRSK